MQRAVCRGGVELGERKLRAAVGDEATAVWSPPPRKLLAWNAEVNAVMTVLSRGTQEDRHLVATPR